MNGFLGTPSLDPDLQPILLDGLAMALVQDAAAITFAFASIQPSAPGQGWLTPPNTELASYGGYLAILGTSVQTSPPAVLDPAIYAGEVDAAFAVSAGLVLSNELVPALCALLPGASFTVAGEPAQATLPPGITIPLASCQVGAITYHPTLDALTLTSADGGIAVSAAGGCDLHGDCSMRFTVQAINQFRFDRSAQQYSFASDPAPSVAHSTHIPWWYAMGGAVVLVIAETVASAVGNTRSV